VRRVGNTQARYDSEMFVCRQLSALHNGLRAIDKDTLAALFNRLGLKSLGAFCQLEFHFFTFGKAFESLALYGTKVDEDIFGAVRHRNEAKTFCIVEPLYGADTLICHQTLRLFIIMFA